MIEADEEGNPLGLTEFGLAVAKGIAAGRRDAIETARRTGTKLVIWRNGRVERITPDEAERLSGKK